MHSLHDDCFNFWSIFIRLPEDRKRVINVDDQTGRLFQIRIGQVPSDSSGWKRVDSGIMIKCFMLLQISHVYKN